MTNLELLQKIWEHLKKTRKNQLLLLFVFMISSGLSEMFSLAAVVPFLSVLTEPEKILKIKSINKTLMIFNINEINQLIFFTTGIFILAIIFSSSIRLINLYLGNFLAARIGSDLGYEAYRRTLYQPYKIHVSRNTSSVISSIVSNTERTVDVLNWSLQTATSIVISIFLLATLFLIDWQVALIAGSIFGLSYFVLSKTLKKKLLKNSNIVGDARKKQQMALQEGLGAIRDVLLDNSQKFYLKIFRSADIPLWDKQAQSQFLAAFPRYGFEALGLVLIAILSLALFIQKGENADLIPTLGFLALGAQRLLPAMQNIYTGWARVKYQSSMVADLLGMIEQEIDDEIISKEVEPITLKKGISIKDLYFKYKKDDTEYILNGINFEILKGERVGIIGPTGSGKSTLVDILMGLLEPCSGSIEIDGLNLNESSDPVRQKAWKAAISHVPQNIYLADTSIKNNIAFGLNEKQINIEMVKNAAKQSQLNNFIKNTRLKYETIVGERGVQLSGGQKQRIGIARAFYKKSKILFLDEATSALDFETEASVMKSIENLDQDITVIIIAHRLSTLEKCDKIIELKNGKIKLSNKFKNQ